MASNVLYKASVEKDLKKPDKPTATRLLHRLEQARSANPNAGEPLSGEFHGLFKYRMGEYRAVYAKTPEGVLVLRIGHRREVHR